MIKKEDALLTTFIFYGPAQRLSALSARGSGLSNFLQKKSVAPVVANNKTLSKENLPLQSTTSQIYD